MGFAIFPQRSAVLAAMGIFLATLVGCQTSSSVSSSRFIEHQAMIDFSGLTNVKSFATVKADCAPPENWERLTLQRGAMYTHQQWRSPSHATGMGIAHVSLPIPLSTSVLLWLAEREYTQKSDDGKVIATWKDELGRSWFEVENMKYHIRGYAVTSGRDGWFAYCGYKITQPMNPGEISLAARSLESVMPKTTKDDAQAAAKPATNPSVP